MSRLNIKFTGGPRPHGLRSHSFRRLSALKLNAVVASVYLTEGDGETDVEMYPQCEIAPIFDQRMPPDLRGIEPLRVLIHAKEVTENVVIPELAGFI